MSTLRTVVVAGAGLAGAKAAETLREEGFDGRIVLLGAERARPYERPPLSKEYLRGETGADKVFVHDEGFYDEHAIELRCGVNLASIDCAAGAVVLGDGERLGYDRLLLATGARPRRLRRRRRRARPPPAAGAQPAGRALGECAQPGPGRGAQHARRADGLRAPAGAGAGVRRRRRAHAVSSRRCPTSCARSSTRS